MSEPKAVAETVDEVVPGVWRWHVLDERIDAESDAHAVSNQGGTVLIDPRELADDTIKRSDQCEERYNSALAPSVLKCETTSIAD